MNGPEYTLVGCPDCSFTWIIECVSSSNTTTCPSCSSTWNINSLRSIESGNELSVLQDNRGRKNAKLTGKLQEWQHQRGDCPFSEQVTPRATQTTPPPLYPDAFADAFQRRQRVRDILADEAEEYLDRRMGPATRESECTHAAEFLRGADNPFPWADDPTGFGKTKLVISAATLGDFPTDWVPFHRVLEAEFDDDSRKHYDRSDRLAEQYPELWEKRQTASVSVEVRPTSEAVYLIRACNPEKPVPWWEPIKQTDSGSDKLPVQRFSESVGCNRGSERGLTDAQQGLALNLLADHRSTLVDEEGNAKRLDSGAKPVVQRFASVTRAQSVGGRYDRWANELEKQFEWGVVLTLTLPRAVADSALHSYEVMADAWKAFRDRLQYDPESSDKPTRPGYVPPYLWVQEPHRDGWAHRHVIFGGERRLMDADDVRRDWADCLHIPNCVDVTPWIRLDTIQLAEGWHVVDSEDAGPSVLAPANASTPAVADGGAVVTAQYRDAGGLRPYYRKGMTRLVEIASLEIEELRNRAERLRDPSLEPTERDRELALSSFTWAAEAPFIGASSRLGG